MTLLRSGVTRVGDRSEWSIRERSCVVDEIVMLYFVPEPPGFQSICMHECE